jgi:hypothetical protein
MKQTLYVLEHMLAQMRNLLDLVGVINLGKFN